MHLEGIPLVGQIVSAGADDRVFDTLIALGPIFLLVVVLLGRTFLTIALAMGYIMTFVGYVLYNYTNS